MRLVKTILLCIVLALTSCKEPPVPKSDLEKNKPKNSKTITFATMNGASTYYINAENKPAGLEYELIQLFMASLAPEYTVTIQVKKDVAAVLKAIESGEADIAASDISITADRKSKFNFSAPYFTVQQQVAYNRDQTPAPRKLAALHGQIITIPAGTSYAERLRDMSEHNNQLAWEEEANTSSEALIEKLANGEITYTILDNQLLSIMQYYYPNVGMAFSIGAPEEIAWMLAKKGDQKLLAKADAFMKKIKDNGTLAHLVDRYYGNTKRLNPFDVRKFLAGSKTLLPKYERLFKSAQAVTDVDWRLLASISYQESHWDTFNTSPTNVRGLMMLTEDTSDMMKVTDRLDPKQSIPAGAKFFLWLKNRFPDRIEDPDRTFMALASYNIGVGHVEDARVLAQRLRLDPDRWVDVKKTLLMLTQPKYYSKAKHGYCNCGAPIIYTENIRSYYSILLQHAPAYQINQDDPFKIASAD